MALATAPAAFGDAVTHQADAVHSGHAKVRGLNPPLHRAWTSSFPDVVSYPVIGGGRVFVTAFTTAADGNTRESEVVAMSLRNGRVLWRRPLGRGVGGQLGLEGDRLFVTRGGYEAPGVEAMSAADGHTLWRDEPNYFSAEPPVPLGGVVYVPLQDHLTAFRSSDGAALWRTGGGIGYGGSVGTPAVAGDDVWLTFACEHVYRLRRSDGAVVWSHVGPCHGGGGETAALDGGRLFSREGDGRELGYVYDAGSGAVLRGLTSTAPAAFRGGLGFFPNGFKVLGTGSRFPQHADRPFREDRPRGVALQGRRLSRRHTAGRERHRVRGLRLRCPVRARRPHGQGSMARPARHSRSRRRPLPGTCRTGPRRGRGHARGAGAAACGGVPVAWRAWTRRRSTSRCGAS